MPCGRRRTVRRWTRSAGRGVVRAYVPPVKETVRRPGLPEIRRLKQLEDENGKLKRLVADLTLDRSMLQDVLTRQR